jgi:WD40-like Beta Propeller Repeat
MSILTRPRPPRADDPSDAEALEALIEEARRRTRRRRRGYAACTLVAAAGGLLAFYGFSGGGGATRAQDPDKPPLSQATNFFAHVHGWIVYTTWWAVVEGDEVGIWAVDPTRPEGDASDRIRLLESPAAPMGWSEDGRKLLIFRVTEAKRVPNGWEMQSGHLQRAYRWEGGGPWGLSVLNADGSLTTVLRTDKRMGWIAGASLSPDGSQVVYARVDEDSDGELHHSGIYVVGTDGGRPHLLKKAGRRHWYAGNGWAQTWLNDPTFSPDGSKIAYFDGADWGHGLRVMNADGSHVRELIESDGKLSDEIGPSAKLVWSPDGSRLAFEAAGGIWVIGADGSGLRKLIPRGSHPSWSPDGSRIAYEVDGPDRLGQLRVADADGKNVQTFTYGGSGPWNPLPPASD